MKTLRMVVNLEYDDEVMHGDDDDERRWFLEKVLLAPDPDGHLILHSNEICDEVGTVRVLSVEPEVTRGE